MELKKVVGHIGTILELRRIASAYVIDHRNLTEDEIKSAIIKTAPQYYFPQNVEKALKECCLLNTSRDVRLISLLLLKHTLLHKDHFMASKREIEDDIISWEQAVIDQSNEDLGRKDTEKGKSIDLLSFVVETAWEHDHEISPDEKNLIIKLKERLKVTDRECFIIEAKLGKFPKIGNQVHTRGEIDKVRQTLQSKGLLFSMRDGEGTDFDVLPDELALALRKALGIEIRQHGFRTLLAQKYVRSRAYLTEVLEKCGVGPEGPSSLEALQKLVLEKVSPSVVLGGNSPRDGLDMETLAKWCGDLDLNVSGSKAERIERIVNFYDNLLQASPTTEDSREIWYHHFHSFASRNLEFLRSQMLIEKDIEVERKFEDATNYLFENRLGHKPLTQVGSEHPDGVISFRDELIFWDNKSKESSVNLKDHIRQFDSYIKNGQKKVACFLVIGPDFTAESSALAMQYQVQNGTTITLVTAEELKSLAEEWRSRASGKSLDPFPLGYLLQPGRFNRALVALP